MKNKNQTRKGDFSSKFSLASILSICFCVAVFTVFQFIFLDDVYLLAAQIKMNNIAKDITQIDFQDEKYKTILSEFEANNTVYIEIYAPRDVLIYTTESNKTIYDKTNQSQQNQELKPRIMRILSHKETKDGSYFDMREEYFTTSQYVVYGRFFGDNQVLEIYYSLDVIRDNARTASWALFALSLVILIVVYLLMWYITISFTKPLRKIIYTTKKMAEMNFDEICPSYKIKDLDELSTSINILSLALSKTLASLEGENRHLEISIEQERKAEKARRTFIANISHELKTPIAIIQGYAEGLKMGVGADSTTEYCDTIIDEAQKMNCLVIRLLEYMHYDSGVYKTNLSRFNLYEHISEIIESRRLQCKEKQIEVITDIPSFHYCYSDTVLFENVFGNYLSNAISHAADEKKIVISVKDTGENLRVSVFNSGKPIPGTDIENIWQSFYRADKAHSRAEGRFGLGLSIVASSQEILGQNYGVINKDNGPEFWFDVKKDTNT